MLKNHLSFIVFLFSFSCLAEGQTVLHCMSDGTALPVYEMRGKIPMRFTGDALERGKAEDLLMLPAEAFGSGFVDVKVRENKRDGVYLDNGVLRFSAGRSWFLFLCTITPDRTLENAYCAMVFDTFGRRTYYAKSLGSLEAGKEKTVRFFMKLKYEMPQELHFYSNGEEIRTTLIPENYSHENGQLVFDSQLEDKELIDGEMGVVLAANAP